MKLSLIGETYPGRANVKIDFNSSLEISIRKPGTRGTAGVDISRDGTGCIDRTLATISPEENFTISRHGNRCDFFQILAGELTISPVDENKILAIRGVGKFKSITIR